MYLKEKIKRWTKIFLNYIFSSENNIFFNYIGAPSGQHHHPCAPPAVEKFTVVKKRFESTDRC